MTATIQKFSRKPVTVDAAEYDGRMTSMQKIIDWVGKHRGTAFPASELHWRHDMGTYWHPVHGFVYLPQGARHPGSSIGPLRDNEIVILTSENIYGLVFPGDYVVRSQSSFYPHSAENFHRSHVSNTVRRGTIPATLAPAV